MNPAHIITPCFYNIHFIMLPSPLCLGLPSDPFVFSLLCYLMLYVFILHVILSIMSLFNTYVIVHFPCKTREKVKFCLVLLLSIAPCRRGGVEVWLHTFLTSALDGGLWSTSHPGRFTPEERARCPLNMGLDRPHSQSGRCGEGKTLPYRESNPGRTSRYILSAWDRVWLV
jgi:hypothetical protein